MRSHSVLRFCDQIGEGGGALNLWWCNTLSSAFFCLSSAPRFQFLNSESSSLLCLRVDINYAASPFRQGLCLPDYLSGTSGVPVLTGSSSINNNHCQSRLFRAEQSEVIWLWKAPQSMSACCDPEMLACKSITWQDLCGELAVLPCADSTRCHGDGAHCAKCMCSPPKGSTNSSHGKDGWRSQFVRKRGDEAGERESLELKWDEMNNNCWGGGEI